MVADNILFFDRVEDLGPFVLLCRSSVAEVARYTRASIEAHPKQGLVAAVCPSN